MRDYLLMLSIENSEIVVQFNRQIRTKKKKLQYSPELVLRKTYLIAN